MFWSTNKPLTRKKGWHLVHKEKSPDKLDVSRRSLEAIDLESLSLRGTNLRDAHLTGVDRSSATLREGDRYGRWYCVRFDGADLRRAKVDLSYIDKAGLALYV